ncbi:unnamed protein product [Sphenostylis stenocarpa]|uniref:Uncharacterized protein n=1 Tax=Sphenostylis stenocarpa TaxID=92480 RepID=A0AA86RTN2_9FABA|nr:unnamed protein product [Sphenostylis stenocarpa]
MRVGYVKIVGGGYILIQQNNDRAVLSSKDSNDPKDPDSVSCYRASNPSNLQQEEAQQAVLAAVPPVAYATTVEVVVVDEKIPGVLIDF